VITLCSRSRSSPRRELRGHRKLGRDGRQLEAPLQRVAARHLSGSWLLHLRRSRKGILARRSRGRSGTMHAASFPLGVSVFVLAACRLGGEFTNERRREAFPGRSRRQRYVAPRKYAQGHVAQPFSVRNPSKACMRCGEVETLRADPPHRSTGIDEDAFEDSPGSGGESARGRLGVVGLHAAREGREMEVSLAPRWVCDRADASTCWFDTTECRANSLWNCISSTFGSSILFM
jgi:hypothetical protein